MVALTPSLAPANPNADKYGGYVGKIEGGKLVVTGGFEETGADQIERHFGRTIK